MVDCFNKVRRVEGLRGFYKGVNAEWMRVGPLTMIQFMVWEQFRLHFKIPAI